MPPSGEGPTPTFAVVGLGNPGSRYEGTRHNLGYRVVDALAGSAGVALPMGPGAYGLARASLGGAAGLLVKPVTFMNRSGVAVKELRERFPDLAPDRLLVVCDDLDLPLGRMRFRAGGGDGGHKGLRSLISELGTRDFPRLRLGIGRPETAGESTDVVDHVLDTFRDDERETVEEVVARGAEGVRIFLTEGVLAAMNRFNPASLDHPGAGQ
ncbi:MAG: aminoacyl-tRNA hydrolase [Candidatus Eiseniibacteriota bacterium]